MQLVQITSFLKKKELWYALVRYTLSPFMMSFGFMKIIGMQFNTIAGPTSAYQQPLEHLTGIELTWAFLGYSTWYQVLLGIFEFVPASLLLFRRTAFFGAVALLPMSVSVLLINFGLHLWNSTQLESLALVFLNLSIFLFEWNRVTQILKIFFNSQTKYKYVIPEVIAAIILMSIPVIRKGTADYGKRYQNILTGDWFHGHPVEFTLISEKTNDSLLPHHMLKSFFGSWEEYSEINDSANNWDGYKIYSIDERDHSLYISSFANRKSQMRGGGYYYLRGSYKYDLRGDSLLILSRKVNDSTSHTWTFRKRVMNPNKEF